MLEEYTIAKNSVDPRGLYLIPKDPAINWNGGASVLAHCEHISFDMAMQMFISQYEYLAYARDFYGYGNVTWEHVNEVRADAELATIILKGYIHLMNYQQGCDKLAIEEMKASPRKWLPVIAACLEQGNYTRLADVNQYIIM